MVELRHLRPSRRLIGPQGLSGTRFFPHWRILAVTLPLFVVSLAGGCRSSSHHVRSARDAYFAGNLPAAQSALRDLADGARRSRIESELDLAIVDLANGEAKSAERALLKLRDHFDSAPESISIDDAAALATDDTARDYRLAGYEQVLLRTLLATCSLAGDGGDATAYCLQAQTEQAELMRPTSNEDAPPVLSSAIALAPYLHGTLREATHQNYDDAERAFRLVSSIEPSFKPAQDDIARAGSGAHSRPGHGALYVLAFVGKGPQLVEEEAATTTASLQIASTLLRSIHKHREGEDDQIVLPNVTSVKVPVVHVPPTTVATVGAAIGGKFLGSTQTLTDVGQLAIERSEAEMPWTIARAVARRVLKESSVTAVSQSIGLTGNAAAIAEFAAINAWTGTEKADTRCWGLLPREFQVLRAELPVGHQGIDLMPMSSTGQFFAEPIRYDIDIEDGRNHYVLVFAPDRIISVVP